MAGEGPSAWGKASARGMAKLANLMALKGTLDGKQYLSEETWNLMHSEGRSLPLIDGFLRTVFTKGGFCHFSYDEVVKGPLLKNTPHKYNDIFEKRYFNDKAGWYGWNGANGSLMQWHPEM